MKLNPNQIAVKKYTSSDSSPTFIFLHDSLGCIEIWRDFPEKVAKLTSYNVIVYDRQGYGKSCPFTYNKRDNSYLEQEADILNELLDYWEVTNAILFGHSDGGSIALITAAKYPHKIKGVITEGAHIFVEDITINGIEEAIVAYKTTDLKSKLEKYHGNKTEAMFWAWASTWTSPEFKNWNIEHFLPLIHCPSLIIQGKDDEYGSLEQVEKIISQTTGKANRLVIEKAKHTPHKEVSELILEETSRFINSIKMK